MTQNNASYDLRDYLINDAGVSLTIFVSKEPDTPIECVTLYNYSDSDPDPKFRIDYPSIQVRSRAATYETAYNNALTIFNKLVGIGQFTKNTTKYTGIFAKTSIFDIGIIIVEPTDDGQHRQ
jgi:hypothetical protein